MVRKVKFFPVQSSKLYVYSNSFTFLEFQITDTSNNIPQSNYSCTPGRSKSESELVESRRWI